MFKRSILVFFLLLGLISAANAAIFQKLPENHWAWQSVEKLMERDIFDKTSFKGFDGQRKMTRYEFAITFSRLLAHVAQKMTDGTILAAKDDLTTMNELCEEFSSELALLGLRNENVEKDLEIVREEVSMLRGDVDEIRSEMVDQQEKVKISGNWLVRSTWKTHKNDWATNPYTGAAQAGNSNNHAMESQVRFRLDAQIDENISMGARFRMLHKNGDTVTGTYTRNSAWGNSGIGGNLMTDNTVDTAFLKIKKLFSDYDEMFLGRAWYWNGHGMLVNAFLDVARYKRVFRNDLTLTFQHIYDRHTGSFKDNTAGPDGILGNSDDGGVDFRGVWNLFAEKKCRDKTYYLGLYFQDEPDLINDFYPSRSPMPPTMPLGNAVGQQSGDSRRDIEFGSNGKLGRCDKFSYDLAFVYSDYRANIVSTTAAPNIDVNRKGWQGLAAINYKASSDFRAKLQYAFGDDENAGGYALTNDARYCYSHETPYEDISRGNAWFGRGLRNMSDLKLQMEYAPARASKHYFRVAADWLRELDDIAKNDLTHHLAGNVNGVIPTGAELRNTSYDNFNNLGIANPSATMITFEYRYALTDNVKIKVGYINCDLTGEAQKATATQAKVSAGRGFNNDYDYNLLWTEVYCLF
jgi:hypothetical protein